MHGLNQRVKPHPTTAGHSSAPTCCYSAHASLGGLQPPARAPHSYPPRCEVLRAPPDSAAQLPSRPRVAPVWALARPASSASLAATASSRSREHKAGGGAGRRLVRALGAARASPSGKAKYLRLGAGRATPRSRRWWVASCQILRCAPDAHSRQPSEACRASDVANRIVYDFIAQVLDYKPPEFLGVGRKGPSGARSARTCTLS